MRGRTIRKHPNPLKMDILKWGFQSDQRKNGQRDENDQ